MLAQAESLGVVHMLAVDAVSAALLAQIPPRAPCGRGPYIGSFARSMCVIVVVVVHTAVDGMPCKTLYFHDLAVLE